MGTTGEEIVRVTDQCLAVRADGGTQIGNGHVMRCLALAQAWQEAGGRVVFITGTESLALEGRLRAERMEIVRLSVEPGSARDGVETARVAHREGARWVVMDGYGFGEPCQRALKDRGLRIVLIDDVGRAGHTLADIVLNQNVHAHEGLYGSREPYSRLLLGTRYALLRREFLQWRNWNREVPVVAGRVLVTMGGSDPDNVTLKVVQALRDVNIEGLEAVVAVGGSNPHHEALLSAVRRSRCSIRVEKDVRNMPELMAWADVAVSAGGITCWELALMGLPSLIVVLADNQRPSAEMLGETGVDVNLGSHQDLSASAIAGALRRLMLEPESREAMIRSGRRLVDGEGARRVLAGMIDGAQGPRAEPYTSRAGLRPGSAKGPDPVPRGVRHHRDLSRVHE